MVVGEHDRRCSVATPSLAKVLPTWVFTVALATCIVAAISPLVAPRAINCRTSCSRSVSDATFVA
jgi:hypothetical protein